jgi:hypothetical protein
MSQPCKHSSSEATVLAVDALCTLARSVKLKAIYMPASLYALCRFCLLTTDLYTPLIDLHHCYTFAFN